MDVPVMVLDEDSLNVQSQKLQLTEEETRILHECTREAVFKKAIPTAIISGLTSYGIAKMGILKHSRFGVKPVVIGFSFLGYWVGRISYNKSVCLPRIIEQCPNGNLTKILAQARRTRDTYVLPVKEPPTSDVDTIVDQNPNSDIDDLRTTSSFDIFQPEYHNENPNPEETRVNTELHNYKSYDDLRKQNRDSYSNRMYNRELESNQSRYPSSLQQGPIIRRPVETPEPQEFGGKQKTKYGDKWD